MAPHGWASPNSLAWATPSLPLWSFSQLPRRPWGRVSRSPLVNKDGQCLPTESQGCGLGMPSTQQSLQANGLPGEILALGLALPSRGKAVGALGTLSQSLGVPASSTLQGQDRKDTVLAPGCTDQRVCLMANRHWPGLGLSMDPAQGLQGSCSSRGIRQKSLWQRDNSTEPSLGLSIGIQGCSIPVWEPGEPNLPLTSCVTLSKSHSRP